MVLGATPYEVRRFTADEVLRMVELGVLDEDEPVELLDGELVVVSPQGPTHRSLTVKVRRLLEKLYRDAFHAQDHSPVLGLPDSLPEPDVAVVRGQPEAYMDRLPGRDDVVLLVEIAVTSGAIDRRKARIYARAGYTTYWLLDVSARRLEVRAGPSTDGEYTSTQLLDENAEVELPELKRAIQVRDLLP